VEEYICNKILGKDVRQTHPSAKKVAAMKLNNSSDDNNNNNDDDDDDDDDDEPESDLSEEVEEVMDDEEMALYDMIDPYQGLFSRTRRLRTRPNAGVTIFQQCYYVDILLKYKLSVAEKMVRQNFSFDIEFLLIAVLPFFSFRLRIWFVLFGIKSSSVKDSWILRLKIGLCMTKSQ